MHKTFRKNSLLTPEAFEALLDDVYAAGEDHRHWTTVLAVLGLQLGSPGGALHAGARNGKGFCFGAAHGVNPAAVSAYADYYYSINPVHAPLSRVPIGEAVPDHHLMAPRDIMRTEFYNDFSRLSGLGGSLTLVLARDDRQEACLSMVRALGVDPFTEEQASFVQRLGPHLRRAISLNRRLAGMQGEGAALETALGSIETAVFIVNRAGVICYSNAAGEKLLEKGDGLKVRQGRLSADDASAQNALAGLMRAALAEKGARGGTIPVPRQCSTRPMIAKIMPIAQRSDVWLNSTQPLAILFVSDPDPKPGEVVNEVMDAYGLTPSETRLLNELIAGRSLREAADILKITRATSRNRLARIMAKERPKNN